MSNFNNYLNHKAMNTKLITFFCLALVMYACPRTTKTGGESKITDTIPPPPITDIVQILQLIDSSGSGYSYVFDDRTIQSEIEHFSRLRDSIKDRVLSDLIQVHLERTKEVNNSFLIKSVAYNLAATSKLLAYTKPPNPCPAGGTNCLYKTVSLSFYTETQTDSLRVISDGQPVMADTAFYDEQTKIKTIKLEQKIEGNVIRMERLDSNGEVTGIYTETR